VIEYSSRLLNHFKVARNTVYTFNLLDKGIAKDKDEIIEASILIRDEGSLVRQAIIRVIAVELDLAAELGNIP
jgi:hypothetical protein